MAARFAILGAKRNIVTCPSYNAEEPFRFATCSFPVANHVCPGAFVRGASGGSLGGRGLPRRASSIIHIHGIDLFHSWYVQLAKNSKNP